MCVLSFCAYSFLMPDVYDCFCFYYRWYEVERNPQGEYRMRQQGTYAPDDGTHRVSDEHGC